MLYYPFGWEILILLVSCALLAAFLSVCLRRKAIGFSLVVVFSLPLALYTLIGPIYFPKLLISNCASDIARSISATENEQTLIEQLRWLCSLRDRADSMYAKRFDSEPAEEQLSMESQDVAFNRRISALEVLLGRKFDRTSSDRVIGAITPAGNGEFDIGLVPQFTEPDTTIVWFIRKNSPAERGGIQPGDEILCIDSRPILGLWCEDFFPLLKGPKGSLEHLVLRRNNHIFEVSASRECSTPDWSYKALAADLERARTAKDLEAELAALLTLGIYSESARGTSWSPELEKDFFDEAFTKASSSYAPTDPNLLLVAGYCASHYMSPADDKKLNRYSNTLLDASFNPFLLRKSDAVPLAMAAKECFQNRTLSMQLWKRALAVSHFGRDWKQSNLEQMIGNPYIIDHRRHGISTAFEERHFEPYALSHLVWAEMTLGRISCNDILPLAEADCTLTERTDSAESWDVEQSYSRRIDMLMKLRRYQEAASLLERREPVQIAIRANPANKYEKLDWLMQDDGLYLGICYEYSRHFQKALSEYKRSFDALNYSAEAGGTFCMKPETCRGLLPRTLASIARCSAAMKNYKEAQRNFEQAIRILPRGFNSEQAVDKTDLALICLQQNALTRAQLLCHEALSAWDAIPKDQIQSQDRLGRSIAEKIVSASKTTSGDALFRATAPGTEPPECYCSSRVNWSPHFTGWQ
jgi:tetratricopeptide (TPR) repeat protein